MWIQAALAAPLLATALPAAAAPSALQLDGVPDEALWANAQVFDDFRVTQPFTQSAPTHPTKALLQSLPEGLAVAFVVSQPAGTERFRPRAGRDAFVEADRVNFTVDFDGDGRQAYNFRVTLGNAIGDESLSNENRFNSDWDGVWDHALHENEEGWSVEILIPWTVAAMREGSEPTRTIGVHFDRMIASLNERSAPASISFMRPRYLSEFTKVEVARHRGQGLLSVIPYASLSHDFIAGGLSHRLGGDLFWKPSGRFQLLATLNPDFGQVEADDLVVDFSATEFLFSDKRPFFTENQGIFDFDMPDAGRLVYTRRIGGPADADGEASDIDAAVKLSANVDGFELGTLVAMESDYADGVGRAFFAQRAGRQFGTLGLGWLATWVDRPWLERSALVNAVDVSWRPDERWSLSGQLLGSRVRQQENASGIGGWLRSTYLPNSDWQHQLELTYYGQGLDFNDMGYQRRGEYGEAGWSTTRSFSTFAEDDRRRSVEWRVEPRVRYNDAGVRLPPAVAIRRGAALRAGGYLESKLTWTGSGYDDLISRGHGLVWQEPRLETLSHGYFSPRIGKWTWQLNAALLQEGNEDLAAQLRGELRYYPRDDLDIGLTLMPHWSRDWLLWREDTLFASYHSQRCEASMNVNWFPGRRQELRMKLQWLGLKADRPMAYRIGADGRLVESNDVVDAFTVNNFGMQLRYRYELGQRRELYVVYGRGGDETLAYADGDVPPSQGLSDLLGRVSDRRDADQLLVKLRWEL